MTCEMLRNFELAALSHQIGMTVKGMSLRKGLPSLSSMGNFHATLLSLLPLEYRRKKFKDPSESKLNRGGQKSRAPFPQTRPPYNAQIFYFPKSGEFRFM
jgi:hypothetical protein